jgi:site-specific DNA-methyltransferase (adenine-specific)
MMDITFKIFNEDCLKPKEKIETASIDLGIFDPPFGIRESSFDKHYKRNSSKVIPGYTEAPENYEEWTYLWMKEAQRILKPNGSMYIFMGNSNLYSILSAAKKLELKEINHIIWKYNFGVFTRNKYVTSHYHILYYAKTNNSKPIFNTYCRFGAQEKNENNGSCIYRDLEDVFIINRDYSPNKEKNQNKLPEELVNKIIMYSSNENDIVCDFFMGNFTTAFSALKLGRYVTGYEVNKNVYDKNILLLDKIVFGSSLKTLKKVINSLPENQGKPITREEKDGIKRDYQERKIEGMNKHDINYFLQVKYGRGKFSIKNILDKIHEENI